MLQQQSDKAGQTVELPVLGFKQAAEVAADGNTTDDGLTGCFLPVREGDTLQVGVCSI